MLSFISGQPGMSHSINALASCNRLAENSAQFLGYVLCMKSLVKPSQGFGGTRERAHIFSGIKRTLANILKKHGNFENYFREQGRLFLGNMVPHGRASLVGLLYTHLRSTRLISYYSNVLLFLNSYCQIIWKPINQAHLVSRKIILTWDRRHTFSLLFTSHLINRNIPG